MNARSGTEVLEALIAATNRRDLDGIVEQFAEDVRSDTPAHPARSFVGQEQVRRNWQQILGAIGDLRATIVASAGVASSSADRETAWAEIAFDGHRPDGATWQMRGVTVNEIVDGRIAALRFYLEPVDDSPLDVDAAVRRAVATPVVATTPAPVATATAGAVR